MISRSYARWNIITYTSVITHWSLWTGQLLVNVCTEKKEHIYHFYLFFFFKISMFRKFGNFFYKTKQQVIFWLGWKFLQCSQSWPTTLKKILVSDHSFIQSDMTIILVISTSYEDDWWSPLFRQVGSLLQTSSAWWQVGSASTG